jgi:hypothetical protein
MLFCRIALRHMIYDRVIGSKALSEVMRKILHIVSVIAGRDSAVRKVAKSAYQRAEFASEFLPNSYNGNPDVRRTAGKCPPTLVTLPNLRSSSECTPVLP